MFIAITAGAEFYGIIGTLLAIPIAAFVQVIVTTFLDERRDAKQPRLRGTIPAWRWMRVSSRDGDPRDGTGTDAPAPVNATPMVATASGGRPPSAATFAPTGSRTERRAGPAAPSAGAPGPSQPTRPSTAAPIPGSTATSVSGLTAPAIRRPGAGSDTPAGGTRSPAGPKWTPEQLRRSTAADASQASVEHDELPTPNRPAIGPGD